MSFTGATFSENNNGPSTEPCGTADSQGTVSDLSPPATCKQHCYHRSVCVESCFMTEDLVITYVKQTSYQRSNFVRTKHIHAIS